MKVEFEYEKQIFATADLEIPLYEDESVRIYGKDYIVHSNYHDVEIDENGTHEKIICSLVTEEEYEEWEKLNTYRR